MPTMGRFSQPESSRSPRVNFNHLKDRQLQSLNF
jgi:hypothetical protein